jgi:hypothetical protein
MKKINNSEVIELIPEKIYKNLLNISYEKEDTVNFLFTEKNINLLMRLTLDDFIVTLVIYLSSYSLDNKEIYKNWIKEGINKYKLMKNKKIIITSQFYEKDSLIKIMRELDFKVNLVLREHIKIEGKFLNVVSLQLL